MLKEYCKLRIFSDAFTYNVGKNGDGKGLENGKKTVDFKFDSIIL